MRAPQPPWMRRVRVGDVLKDAVGNLRVVREARHYGGRLYGVTFTIAHCSWTGRCYTILNATDLRQRGFRPVGVRRRLNTKLDRQIADAIARNDLAHRNGRALRCCDVEGIA